MSVDMFVARCVSCVAFESSVCPCQKKKKLEKCEFEMMRSDHLLQLAVRKVKNNHTFFEVDD